MNKIELIPEAAPLLESLRSIGYSLEAAVADLIDNSIAAGAEAVWLWFPPGVPDHLALVDNGRGMSAGELIDAMRHGSKSDMAREPTDLGRFGLGLKTASLSQSRCLTVVSKKDGQISGCRWDLDYVRDKKRWWLLQLDSKELEALPHMGDLRSLESGTLVILTALDRLVLGDMGDGVVVSARMEGVRQHLALVFHRFLTAEQGVPSLRICINQTQVEGQDPFLTGKRSSLQTAVEKIRVAGHLINVTGFTLPHISKLRPDEIEAAGGSEGLRRQQGFYVYRNFRLIVWGTWFRLMKQEELTKLTRVRVDLPNALDHLWTLDIKKSAASPPEQVRTQLRALVPRFCADSRTAQVHRARVQTAGKTRPIWRRLEERNAIQYRVDHEHPVVSSFLGALEDQDRRDAVRVLRAIEESFPGEAFYNDRALDRVGFLRTEVPDDDTVAYLEDLARQIISQTGDQPEVQANLLTNLPAVEPFFRYPEATEKIIERIRHEHGLGKNA